MRRFAIAALGCVLACSGDSKSPSTTTSTGTTSTTETKTDPEWTVPMVPNDPPPKKPTAPTDTMTASHASTTNSPPELVIPAVTAIGVKQTASFGVVAIDQDLDTIRVDLIDKPASATWDPLTLTVTWTPTRKDQPGGNFTAQVTEVRADGTRTYEHTFHIAVTRKAAAMPTAATQGDVVEQLITIHDPARLAAANKKWPFEDMLLASAQMFRDEMPAEAAAKVGKLDKKQLYTDFLTALYATHDNPRIDPSSPSFDKKAFGKASAWKIVTVRPRLDKKWQELRVVYQNTAAPEPVFAMFRIRPTHTTNLPAGAREVNNRAFSQLVWDALFDAEGNLNAKNKDAKTHGKAVAQLISNVIAYEGAQDYERGSFVALPTAARLGGGSARDDDGNYESGDGWAWAAQKPLPAADGTALVYQNIRIKGFWTATAPSPDNKAWVATCAPRFDPDDSSHVEGYEVLCRKAEGLVDFPAMEDGVIVSGKKEAQNLYVDHKNDWSVANLPLRDPRRDQGEEKGMTCSQCHTRNFGVRDYYDATTIDPSAGTPTAMNKPLATTPFIIVPTDGWTAYTLDFQKDQECRAKEAFSAYLNKETSLGCPLAPR